MSKIQELKKQIAALQADIEEIQNECSHPPKCVTIKHGSNTGNYDPTADCYWTDFHCTLCDKFWSEDESK